MKKYIKSAAEDMDERLPEAIDGLSEDFDYIVSGLEKLGRDGATGTNDALVIAESLSNALQGAIGSIADKVGMEEE